MKYTMYMNSSELSYFYTFCYNGRTILSEDSSDKVEQWMDFMREAYDKRDEHLLVFIPSEMDIIDRMLGAYFNVGATKAREFVCNLYDLMKGHGYGYHVKA